MVGGAPGGFMGDVHRMAQRMTGRFMLAAGALSSDPQRAVTAGTMLGLPPDRSYADWRDMAAREAARPDGIQVVSIVTPNYLHLPVARAFMDHGITVICDKPLSADPAEAEAFARDIPDPDARFIVTYTYSGYAMVRHARHLVASGALGRIRMIQVEYPQDWMALPSSGNLGWRQDIRLGGAGGCLGDIGTHALHLAEFTSGLECRQVSALLTRIDENAAVPDSAQLLLRFADNATGGMWVSQVAAGCGNALCIRIYGEKAALGWQQEYPDQLSFTPLGKATQILERGSTDVSEPVFVPRGHPEGYVSAFARLYDDAANLLTNQPAPLLPRFSAGLRGMRFIEAALQSSRNNGQWHDIRVG
ncbi:Gfo/Idh/MocA family oxidoreductase [Komagataeibacter sp. FXV3]|nr:Gfo/Idh/MocA family oxidoreductase [Komagataeibacter sp. FXV3]